jgi:hypothetical protein
MTPTMPFPLEASEVSWWSAVKLGVMSPTEMLGAAPVPVVAPPAGEVVLVLGVELDELQAASRRAALTAAAAPTLFLREDTNIPRFLYTQPAWRELGPAARANPYALVIDQLVLVMSVKRLRETCPLT